MLSLKHIFLPILDELFATFDRRFAGFNVREHEHEIRHYEEQAQQGTDPEIKAYAERVVKMLSRELERAKKLEQALQVS